MPHSRRMALSSAALMAFLKRAPERPLTRLSHSAHVAWRMARRPPHSGTNRRRPSCGGCRTMRSTSSAGLFRPARAGCPARIRQEARDRGRGGSCSAKATAISSHTLVAGGAHVSADPAPVHAFRSARGREAGEAFPQIAIEHVAALRRLPVPLPPSPHPLGDALDHVRGVGVDRDRSRMIRRRAARRRSRHSAPSCCSSCAASRRQVPSRDRRA